MDKCGHLTIYEHLPIIHTFFKRLYLTSLENCDDRHGPEGLDFVKTQTNIKFRRRCHMAPLMSFCALMLSLRLPDADIYNLFVSQKRGDICLGPEESQVCWNAGFASPWLLSSSHSITGLRCLTM